MEPGTHAHTPLKKCIHTHARTHAHTHTHTMAVSGITMHYLYDVLCNVIT